MEPDGYITVYPDSRDYENEPQIFLFKDVKFWAPKPEGLSIEFAHGRTVYPWASIYKYVVTKNSDDYYKWYMEHRDNEDIDPRKHPADAHRHITGG